jgi:hypothetical protein
VGAFPVWRPNLDELNVDSAPASAFLILKSFKIIPLQLGCRVPARVLACLLSDGPVDGCGHWRSLWVLVSPLLTFISWFFQLLAGPPLTQLVVSLLQCASYRVEVVLLGMLKGF